MFPGNWLQVFEGVDEAQACSDPMGGCTVGWASSVDDCGHVQLVDKIAEKGREQSSSQIVFLETSAFDLCVGLEYR